MVTADTGRDSRPSRVRTAKDVPDTMSSMFQKVVLAYHKSNQALVDRLDQDLIKRGIEAWSDTRDVSPGRSKWEAIYEAIVASKFFLACLSPQFLEDEFCRTQLFLARAYNKQVLPILVSDSWPENNVEVTLVNAGLEHSHAVKGIEELLYLDFSGKHDTTGGS
jgi:hypothetical protein